MLKLLLTGLSRWLPLRKAKEEDTAEFFGAADDPSDPRLLRHTLEQLVFTRIITLTLFLTTILVSLVTTGEGFANVGPLCWSIAVVFAVSIVNILMLKRVSDGQLRRFAASQFAVDAILATGAIAVSNTAVSMFLYLFLIVAAALVLGRKPAVALAAGCGLAYSLLTAKMYGSASADLTFSDVLTVYVSLVGVAILASYLARRFEVVGELARQQAKYLTQLRGERAGIFEDLSEGVILLDQNGRIADSSPAACSILGWSPGERNSHRGEVFKALLEPLICVEDRANLPSRFEQEAQLELRIGDSSSSPVRHLSLSCRPLQGDVDGKTRGCIIVLSDKSHERSIEERLRLHEKMAELLADSSQSLSGQELRIYYADMAGDSPVMKRVFDLVERVAGSNASVLIEGESGTGKELIARAIHQRGPRKEHPFVAINCGALPENLIESELFGHRKGAFTGASQDSQGLFRQAHGGTLFLDEIGELPLHLQTKLLRVLQDKAVRAVGDTKDYSVDVRVLAATNRDLRNEVHAARFREDLYYRLNVVNISVPPLRDRREDIPLLIRHFLGRFCRDQSFPQVSPEALQLLMLYPFPGNIRELENIIERALVLGGTAILSEHLPEEVRKKADTLSRFNGETQIITLPINLERELETLERAYLMRALSESNGIKKNAAEMLGLNFRSFRYRLKKYSLASESGGLGAEEDGEEEQGLET